MTAHTIDSERYQAAGVISVEIDAIYNEEHEIIGTVKIQYLNDKGIICFATYSGNHSRHDFVRRYGFEIITE